MTVFVYYGYSKQLLKYLQALTNVTKTLKIINNTIGNTLMLFSCLKHSYLNKRNMSRLLASA